MLGSHERRVSVFVVGFRISRSETRQAFKAQCINGLCCLYRAMSLADRRAERGRTFRVHHADDPASAGRPEDHKPVYIHTFLYRGDGVRWYRYVRPNFPLVRDMRREHLHTGDGEAGAGGCVEKGGSARHRR